MAERLLVEVVWFTARFAGQPSRWAQRTDKVVHVVTDPTESICQTVTELGFDGSQPLADLVLLRAGHDAGWRFEYGIQAVRIIKEEHIRFQGSGWQTLRIVKISERAAGQAA